MNYIRLKSTAMFLAVSLALGVFTMGTATAQFSIGIKVAGNADNYMHLTKTNIGMEAGVFLRLGEKFYFQPELNYVFKNSTFQDQTAEFSTNQVLQQHFLSVPALLGYQFINKENFKFHLTIGPRFDFRLKDNMTGTDWSANAVQWGGQIGAGIDFWRFVLDFNYCIAADNFRNSHEGTSQTQQMNMFILSLGFKFIK